jgi:CheY-like chemotaxis protein
MSVATRSILHVEDDPNDVLLLQRAVKRANLPILVSAVGDGESAIAYLSGDATYSDRVRFPMPDLVLLDLKIPRKSGLEVLSWMRLHPQFRRLPVAVLTSSRHDRDMEQAYDGGANSYLVKPVGFDALLEMMTVVNAYWFALNQRPAL